MNELLDEALEELKRVDHLIYVTLKYTRTVDVIKNIVYRLKDSCELVIDALLQFAKKKRMIKIIPTSPLMRISELRKPFSRKDKQKIQEFINFYSTLRKIEKADYIRHGEYRKNVSLIVLGENKQKEFEVTIDVLNEYYRKAQEFIEFAREYINRK